MDSLAVVCPSVRLISTSPHGSGKCRCERGGDSDGTESVRGVSRPTPIPRYRCPAVRPGSQCPGVPRRGHLCLCSIAMQVTTMILSCLDIQDIHPLQYACVGDTTSLRLFVSRSILGCSILNDLHNGVHRSALDCCLCDRNAIPQGIPVPICVCVQEALSRLMRVRAYSQWITPASGFLLVTGGTYALLSRVLDV